MASIRARPSFSDQNDDPDSGVYSPRGKAERPSLEKRQPSKRRITEIKKHKRAWRFRGGAGPVLFVVITGRAARRGRTRPGMIRQWRLSQAAMPGA